MALSHYYEKPPAPKGACGFKMPCSIYKGKQRALCYATKEWKDWKNIKIKKGVNKKLLKKMKGGKKK